MTKRQQRGGGELGARSRDELWTRMSSERVWMYKRRVGGYLSIEFIEGVENFVAFASTHAKWKDGDMLKCPCKHVKCRNISYRDTETITYHLVKNGFVPNYYIWSFHGESHLDELDGAIDVGGQSNSQSNVKDNEEPPNPEAKRLKSLKKDDTPTTQLAARVIADVEENLLAAVDERRTLTQEEFDIDGIYTSVVSKKKNLIGNTFGGFSSSSQSTGSST